MVNTKSWLFFIRINPILALELSDATIVSLHGNKIRGKSGDYLCSNKENTEQWIVKPGSFHKVYKLVHKKGTINYKTWNLYNELQPIKAIQLNKEMVLQNEKIRKIGKKGDYLCSNKENILWIVPQNIMATEYKQLTRKNSFCW